MAAYMGVLLHRRGCPRSLLTAITHHTHHQQTGRAAGFPARATLRHPAPQHHRGCTFIGRSHHWNNLAPRNLPDELGYGPGHSRARAMRADYVLSAAAKTSLQAATPLIAARAASRV